MRASAADRRRAALYLRCVADALGLRDWRFDVLDDPPREDDVFATVDVMHDKRHADVRLASDWPRLPPSARREALVHEVLHCHGAQTAALAEDVREQLSSAAWDLWHTAYHRAAELSVDALAHALAPLMPPYPA